jgi:hypothetical protein
MVRNQPNSCQKYKNQKQVQIQIQKTISSSSSKIKFKQKFATFASNDLKSFHHPKICFSLAQIKKKIHTSVK